jgi:hypothetical protein
MYIHAYVHAPVGTVSLPRVCQPRALLLVFQGHCIFPCDGETGILCSPQQDHSPLFRGGELSSAVQVLHWSAYIYELQSILDIARSTEQHPKYSSKHTKNYTK